MLAGEGLAQGGHDGIVAEALDGADHRAVAAAGMGDARAGAPSISTVQAPHTPCSQPRCCRHPAAAQQVGELLGRLDQHLVGSPFTVRKIAILLMARLPIPARRSAVSARARRQAVRPGTPATMRAASAAGSRISACASPITSGGPSSAASTARGGWPGSASTQEVALENSPTLRHTSGVPRAPPPAAPGPRRRAELVAGQRGFEDALDEGRRGNAPLALRAERDRRGAQRRQHGDPVGRRVGIGQAAADRAAVAHRAIGDATGDLGHDFADPARHGTILDRRMRRAGADAQQPAPAVTPA